MKACNAIHASPSTPLEPALIRMLDTLTSKYKSKSLSKKILSSKPALVKELKNTVIKEWCEDISVSEENKLRSLNVYYSHNVMG